ncbi:MAG: hypothetical protein Q3972_07670 [Corynebacterium sp.]|nr:hypothetical protein [Corynebacterium sp.]
MLPKKNLALLALTGAAALALGACSAGQVSQTADQVAAVDGAAGDTADGTLGVRDVAIVVDSDNAAALRFTAFNNEVAKTTHTLESVTVGGAPVTLNGDTTIDRGCSLFADSAATLEEIPVAEDACINQLETSLSNPGFAYGGTKQVVFKFDNDKTITVDAAIVAPTLPAGEENRIVGDAHSDNEAAH